MIHGLRILDNFGEYLVNEHWHRPPANQAQGQVTGWKHFKIPTSKEIVGLYGSHDGSFFSSLGLILWRPNPAAI